MCVLCSLFLFSWDFCLNVFFATTEKCEGEWLKVGDPGRRKTRKVREREAIDRFTASRWFNNSRAYELQGTRSQSRISHLISLAKKVILRRINNLMALETLAVVARNESSLRTSTCAISDLKATERPTNFLSNANAVQDFKNLGPPDSIRI